MTIKASIRLLFGIFVAVFCGFAYFTIDRLSLVNDQSTQLAEKWLPRVVELQKLSAALSHYRVIEARHILTSEPALVVQADKDAAERTDRIQSIADKYGTFELNDTEVAEFEAVTTAVDEYMVQSKQMLSVSRQNRKDEALAAFRAAKASYDEKLSQIDALADLEIAGGAAASVRGDEIYASVVKITIAISAAIVFLAIGAAVFFDKRVSAVMVRLADQMKVLANGNLDVSIEGKSRPDEVGTMAKAVQIFKDNALKLRQSEQEAQEAREAQSAQRDRQLAIDGAKAEDLKILVHAVEAGFDGLSSGDLTTRMNQALAPEFEPIRTKFNDSVAELEATIGSVVGAVGAIRVGLNQITVASGDLSQRTEQQAASLEETVAALAEVTRGVNDTAQSAGNAQLTVTTAQKNAEKGGAIVGQAVEAMNQIAQSSDKIGKIIGVIDEIAFQTNLLALNAGVEAARAGEAGRGFAVVAQEVRGLAQRSAEAAKEIKDLISTSSSQVEQGVQLVTASGRSLEEIVSHAMTWRGSIRGCASLTTMRRIS